MRKVTFGGASSFDNHFARKDHSVDWLMWSDEAASMMTDYWKTIDTILMGRKTFEVALKNSKGKTNPYQGIKSYVFSRTLQPGKAEGVEIIQKDAAAFVKKLKGQKGKDICVMGGGYFAKTLFEANLIDEIGFNIHPVLLGSGIPVFYEMSHQIDLELLTCKAFKNGCVVVTYRVKH
jgi:dihydrofolate reductase